MDEYESKNIDWYLFFDLLQASKDILNLTTPENIIILIGDTPSYLAPFLEKERKIFHFAFSNKPFGCFMPPYATPYEYEALGDNHPDRELRVDTFTPKIKTLNYYFDYLEKETALTRLFVKNNWKNLILVDSSSGASVHGVSIFFNRYVENIKEDGEIKCTSIKGSEPLQFIQLSDGYYPALNLEPSVAEKNYPEKTAWHIKNYRPDLIIHLGISIFYHRSLFVIADAYPRLLPFYSISDWINPPERVINNSFDKALENIKTFKFLSKLYEHIKNKNPIDLKMSKEILSEIKLIDPIYQKDTIDHLEEFLNNINKDLLYKKFDHYFK